MFKSLAAAAALLLCVASPALASTTLTYAGNEFTRCWMGISPSCATGNVAGSFTTSLDLADLKNLTDANITSTITAFSFSAKSQDFQFGDTIGVHLTTDGSGDVINWYIFASHGDRPAGTYQELVTNLHEPIESQYAQDYVVLSYLYIISPIGPDTIGPNHGNWNSNSPGTWSIAPVLTGEVPEPATWAMFLIGFGAIGFALRQAKRPAMAA